MPTSTPPTTFVLPDLVSMSDRFTLGRNPHLKRATAEARAWLESRGVLNDRTRTCFRIADMELLVARCYPSAPYEEFRTVCDFILLLLVFDEVQLLDVSSATLLADVLSWFWRMGGVIVGTSNKVPDDLYKNGVQRE